MHTALPTLPLSHQEPRQEQYRMRDRSRASTSRPSSTVSIALETHILPDRPVEETTVLLSDFNRSEGEDTGSDEEDEQNDYPASRVPRWKALSPLWLLGIATSITAAPRIEIYTMLACQVYKPDILKHNISDIEAVNGYGSWLRDTSDYTHISPVVPALSPFMKHDEHTQKRVPHSTIQVSTIEPSVSSPLQRLCAQDPVVQAAVAKLAAVTSACVGLLSCVTTGWWTSLSDRRGRTFVMGISVIGLLLNDWNTILVTLFYKYVPGKYWFLVIGPLIEGCVGGLTTCIAVISAYIADTTTENQRSGAFSTTGGLIYLGMSLGPSLGGLLIRLTGRTLSVFFLAASLHITYACLVWFFLPESLSRQQLQRSMVKYNEELELAAQERRLNPAVGWLLRLKVLFGFLSPLSIFKPISHGDPLKRGKRDWNLTLITLSYGLILVSMMGSYSYKFQYAAATFGWTSETLSYWISLIDATRATFLTLILPFLIGLLKPKHTAIELPPEPAIPDQYPGSTPESDLASYYHHQRPEKEEVDAPRFDLGIVRVSFLVDALANACMGLSLSPVMFTLFGMLGSLSAGFNPAAQSVLLALYARRGGTESGRLLGAASIVQALCSQIIGPPLFGLVYVNTVSDHPRTIFFFCVITGITSLLVLTLVRLPGGSQAPGADIEESNAN